MSGLLQFPDDLFALVLSNLNGADLGRAFLICRKCAAFFAKEQFWQNWCRQWLDINKLDEETPTFREAARAGFEFVWDPKHSKQSLVFSERNRVVTTNDEGASHVVMGRKVFRPGDCRFWEIRILDRSREDPAFTFGVAKADFADYASYLDGLTNASLPTRSSRALQVYLDLRVRGDEYIAQFIDGELDHVLPLRDYWRTTDEWAAVGLRPAISLWEAGNRLELDGGQAIPQAMMDAIVRCRKEQAEAADR
eukprot:GAFH01003240.1.p1 GENE.GAFH01003240.1~~GAFH01003240.1.p1  ORF type:complete len:273 (+),score=30.94 GAFH01003240.1:68-820(+)